MNNVICVETQITKWGRRSAVIQQVVKHKGNGTVVADAEVTFVIVNTDSHKITVLEGEILDLLKTV